MNGDFMVYGFSAALLILGIVQAAKEAGLQSRRAPLLALLIGVLLGAAEQHSGSHPDYVHGMIRGVGAALWAMGIFSAVAAFTKPHLAPDQLAPTSSSGAPTTE